MTKPVSIPNTFANQTGNIPVSQVDTNFTTLAAAINDPATYSNYAVDGGVANAYVITLNPAPSTLASLTGVPILFKAVHTNTGSSTININGLGITNIFKSVNVNLVAGDIQANGIVAISFDGTNFQFLSSYSSISAGYYAVTVGTDTYTATLGLISYVTGTEYKLDFGNANTVTNPTINIDSLGAKNILRFDGSALFVGDLLGQQTLLFDGTNMVVKNPRHVLQGESLGAATATTAAIGDNSTKVATTAFVQTSFSGTTNIRGTRVLGISGQPQNTTSYFSELGRTGIAENIATFVCCRPCRIRNLYVSSSANPPAGQTFVVTLRKNAANTTLTATISNNVQVSSDTTHTVDFGIGDKVSFQSVASATSGTSNINISFCVVDVGSNSGISMIPFNYTSSATLVSVVGGINSYTDPTGPYDLFPVCSPDTYMGNIIVQNPTAPDQGSMWVSSSTTTKVYFGTANGLGTASFTSFPLHSATSTDCEFFSPYLGVILESTNSYYTIQAPIATTSRIVYGSFSLKTPYGNLSTEISPIYFSSVNQAQATTFYMGGHGSGTASATENVVQVPVMSGTLRNFVLFNTGTGVAAQTWTATVRVNGVATAAVLTLSGTSTYIADTSTSVTVNSGDLVSVQLVSSASTGTRTIQFAMEHMV